MFVYYLICLKLFNCNLEHFSINRSFGMPQIDGSQTSQEEDKISSMFEDTFLEKSNIILLGPTGCGKHLKKNYILVL